MKSKFVLVPVLAAALAAATAAVLAKPNANGLIVHEWGTFTSLQGGDGKLIPWKPLKTAELPKFVYNWRAPELGLVPSSMYGPGGKGSIVALQRMETPVIYFYSDQEQTVDVTVKFPKGFITEWYPRVSQIGPSVVANGYDQNPSVVGTDSRESLIRWSNLHLIGPDRNGKPTPQLPTDASGSHYFAARETDANYIETSAGKEPSPSQYENFLFYRGVGDFETPMRATMIADGRVSVMCNAWAFLRHVFVLEVKDTAGSFSEIDLLGPGETKTISTGNEKQYLPAEVLSKRLSEAMARALVREGLYPKEAQAMVNTWKGSWFAEDGIRVLYVLPRVWTDAALPMTLDPQPTKLVRVMVGRAEILSPGLEQSLTNALNDAKHGDAVGKEQLATLLKSLGRFAEPALMRAFAKSPDHQEQNGAYLALLHQRQTSN